MAKFRDRIANRYSKQPIADEASYQRKLAITRKYFIPDSKILDFGCGAYSTAISHAPYVKHIHAIDISANMIDIAREKGRSAGIKNLSFEQTSLLELDSPNNTWDVILGMSILHLLDDRTREIQRAYDLLQPGAVFSPAHPASVIWTLCRDAFSLFSAGYRFFQLFVFFPGRR